jgi:hypothetical protein
MNGAPYRFVYSPTAHVGARFIAPSLRLRVYETASRGWLPFRTAPFFGRTGTSLAKSGTLSPEHWSWGLAERAEASRFFQGLANEPHFDPNLQMLPFLVGREYRNTETVSEGNAGPVSQGEAQAAGLDS